MGTQLTFSSPTAIVPGWTARGTHEGSPGVANGKSDLAQLTATETAAPVEAVDVPVCSAASTSRSYAPSGPGEDVLEAVEAAAHALAYIMIANQRFTDLYTWGKRTRPPTLPAEIQYQLLLPRHCRARQLSSPSAELWNPRR
jgi:hypothetical protein